MLQVQIPASQLSLNPLKEVYKVIKYKFSYDKTKENLSKLFEAHDSRVQADRLLNPSKPTLTNVPQSFIDTAFALTKLFIAEYQKGKNEGNVIRFTWSYLKKSLVGSKLTIRSLQRHVDRFLNDLTFDFIKVKFRSTLNEVTTIAPTNTSCIALEFSPYAVRCVDNSQNELWEKGITKKLVEYGLSNEQVTTGLNDEMGDPKKSESFSGGFLGAIKQKFAKKQKPQVSKIKNFDPPF